MGVDGHPAEEEPGAAPDPVPPPSEPAIHWFDSEGIEHSLDLPSTATSVTIGRRADCDLALPWDEQVSRVHARLERVAGDWTVRDDGLSRNGTWVNGERLHGSRRLIGGDTVRVGRTLLVLHAPAPPESLLTIGVDGSDDVVPEASPRVVVRLCGPLTVQIDGNRLEGKLSGRKGRRLFAYLAANRDRAVRRDELTEILWPRERPSSPEDGLNVHLARLRSLLGKDAVRGFGGEVQLELGTDASVDIEDAVRLRDQAYRELSVNPPAAVTRARAAILILRQDFLPEFDDDEWVREQRLRLQELVPELLEITAEACLALGGSELPAAEAAARELLNHRPYRESDYRLLMRAHAARGNTPEALLVYEQLRKRLIDDLGVPPTAETRQLYERLIVQGGDIQPPDLEP
jgi:SARP family transcriptional regulator, regulator of embCAB operon